MKRQKEIIVNLKNLLYKIMNFKKYRDITNGKIQVLEHRSKN